MTGRTRPCTSLTSVMTVQRKYHESRRPEIPMRSRTPVLSAGQKSACLCLRQQGGPFRSCRTRGRTPETGRYRGCQGAGRFPHCCDVMSTNRLPLLRQRKRRSNKPFALMSGDLSFIRQCCEMDATEEELLTSPQRPVVLLRKKEKNNLPDEISPGNAYIGFCCRIPRSITFCS